MFGEDYAGFHVEIAQISTYTTTYYHSALDTALVRIRAHQPYTRAGLELAFSAGWEAAKPLAIATDINGPI